MTIFNLTTTYTRTPKGERALKYQNNELTPVQRKLLVLLDGSNPLSKMAATSKLDIAKLEADGTHLLALDLIQPHAPTNNLDSTALYPSKSKRKPTALVFILAVATIGTLGYLAFYQPTKSSSREVASKNNNTDSTDAQAENKTTSTKATETTWLQAFQAGANATDNKYKVPEVKENPSFNRVNPNQKSASSAVNSQPNVSPQIPNTLRNDITASAGSTASPTITKEAESPKEALAASTKLEALPTLKSIANSSQMIEPGKLVRAVPKLINRVTPDFPREAIIAGITSGNVKVRLTITAKGTVSKVEIIEAQPRRVFDKAVIRALSEWKFEEIGEVQVFETEVGFKR